MFDCTSVIALYVGGPAMFDSFSEASVDLSDPEAANSFRVAVEVDTEGGGRVFHAFASTWSTPEMLTFIREGIKADLERIYDVELTPEELGDADVYDCHMGSLAELWHAATTGRNPTGIRRLTMSEISWLLRHSLKFIEAFYASGCAEQSGYDPANLSPDAIPLVMDGYGYLKMPELSCVSVEDPETKLPENELPPPPGIDPVSGLDGEKKEDESSIVPWIIGGAGVLGVAAVLLAGKGK